MNNSQMAVLPIHFDVPNHHFLASDYLITLESFKTVTQEINRVLFNNKIKYDFLVLPSEDGSFLSKFALYIAMPIPFIVSVAQIPSTPFFNEIALELTGRTLEERELGTQLAQFISDSVVGFFETESDKLDRVIPMETNLDKAIAAKTTFYKMCISNPVIEGLGFSLDSDFPIRSNNFSRYISKDRIKPASSDFILFEDATLVSPIDTEDDYKWRLRHATTNTKISANMRDENFKSAFLHSGKYPLKQTGNDDRMTILVEYEKQLKNGEIIPNGTFINEVYKFNDEIIKPIPDEIIGKYRFTKTDNRPMDAYWT